MPKAAGTPEAMAMPNDMGMATKKPTNEAKKSLPKEAENFSPNLVGINGALVIQKLH
jgi:hypothetical protein